MPFFVYGSDATTGEVVKRFLSETLTEAEAREEALARGVVVSAVVACRKEQPTLQPFVPPAPSLGGRMGLDPSMSDMAAFEEALSEFSPSACVTYGIVGVNVLIFILMVVSGSGIVKPTGGDLLRWGAEFGPHTANGQWWRIVTATFVHVGIFHLAFNMLAFLYVGPTVERMIGHSSFLLVYLIAGLGGSLWGLYWNPMLIHAGASGAIFGVYGALLVVISRLRDSIPPQVAANLRKFVLVFVVYNVANSLRPGISLAAHVGGLVAGLVCALAIAGEPFSQNNVTERPWRKMRVWAFGAVLLVVGVVGVQAKYPNLNHLLEILEHFDTVEQQSHTAFTSAAGKAKQHQLSDADFADVIESNLLPDWRSISVELKTLSSIPFSRVTKLQTYVRLRLDSLEALAGSLRNGSKDAMQQATAKQDQADKMSSWSSAAKTK